MFNKQKKPSILAHVISVLLLPFNVTLVIPALLLYIFRNGDIWGINLRYPFVMISIGTIIIAFGLSLVVLTIKQFASKGEGTLAPWNPPNKLVVSGPYQYSRNPMISGVMCILFGEAILFGSLSLLIWAIAFSSVNYTYFIIFEEPQLSKKFGNDYLEYMKNVPRLFPRRTPWKQNKND